MAYIKQTVTNKANEQLVMFNKSFDSNYFVELKHSEKEDEVDIQK